jgi:hypothetical protein
MLFLGAGSSGFPAIAEAKPAITSLQLRQNTHPMNIVQRLSSFAIIGFISLCGAVRAADAKRPNIVFIFSDDHAYQAIGAYNDPRKLINTACASTAAWFRTPFAAQAAPPC